MEVLEMCYTAKLYLLKPYVSSLVDLPLLHLSCPLALLARHCHFFSLQEFHRKFRIQQVLRKVSQRVLQMVLLGIRCKFSQLAILNIIKCSSCFMSSVTNRLESTP